MNTNLNLSVFNFENSEVRFVDGLPIANDVAKVLGYVSYKNAVKDNVDSEYKKVVELIDFSSATHINTKVTVLLEAGIYQLIFKSKLSTAIKFQKWIFEEVLPQIRATGIFNPCPFKLSDDSSLVRFEEDDYWTTSATIAEFFGEEHYNVLRDLEQAQKDALKFEGMSKNLPTFKLVESTYLDKYGRATKCYRINRSLFNYVVLAYQGDNAKLYRMMFIKAFEDLELKVKVFLTQQMIYQNPKRQQVYVLKNTVSGMVKIGITNDINRRIVELQNASGCEISVEYLAPKSDNARDIELLLHKHFADKRGVGEWFNVSSDLVINLLQKQDLNINIQNILKPVDVPQYEGVIDVALRLGWQVPAKYESGLGLSVKRACGHLLMGQNKRYSNTGNRQIFANMYPANNKEVESAVTEYCLRKSFYHRDIDVID